MPGSTLEARWTVRKRRRKREGSRFVIVKVFFIFVIVSAFFFCSDDSSHETETEEDDSMFLEAVQSPVLDLDRERRQTLTGRRLAILFKDSSIFAISRNNFEFQAAAACSQD